LLQVAKIPSYPGLLSIARLGGDPEAISGRRRTEIQLPRFCKASYARFVGGYEQSHSREELAPALNLACEFAMKILIEDPLSPAKSKSRSLGIHDP